MNVERIKNTPIALFFHKQILLKKIRPTNEEIKILLF